VVASIFVNPIQFNQREDFEKYPRDLEKDKKLLEEAGCDVLFSPSEKEMYPEPDNTRYDFGHLDKIMEGYYRPGHFNGVAIVVKKLLEIVKPGRAYFGEKDYQQYQVIKELVKTENIPTEIVACPIIRDKDGLAKSSRNQRLSPGGREKAVNISAILFESRKIAGKKPVPVVEKWVFEKLQSIPGLEPEYFKIVTANGMKETCRWNTPGGLVGCTAAWLEGVRLIDNVKYNL
jgi:pantoate--beta-alanine ligase